MPQRRLVLVEACPEAFSPEAGDDVVASSHEACFRLDQQGIAYRIADDLGSEAALRAWEDAYWDEQLAWLDALDAQLRQRLPDLRSLPVGPAVLYGYYMKAALDRAFTCGVEATTLIRHGYDRVTLWMTADASSPLLLGQGLLPKTVQRSVWAQMCAHRGIPFEERCVPSEAMRDCQAVLPLSGRLRTGGRRIREQLQRTCWSVDGWAARGRPRRRLTLLFLDTQFELDRAISVARRAGHRCLVLDGDVVREVGWTGRSFHMPSRARPAASREARRWADVAATLCASESPLWRWPNAWCGCPMDSVLAPELRSWIASCLPETVRLRSAFQDLYAREAVDFAVASLLSHRMHFPAVAACGQPGTTQSVLVAHGEGWDVAKAWDLHELFPYQHYVVSSHELADYFESRRRVYARATAQVHVGASRWLQYARLRRRPRWYLQRWDRPISLRINRPPIDLPAGRPVAVYVTAWPQHEFRYLNKFDYADTWYYRFQRAVLTTLASMTDYTIVIKPFLMQNLAGSAVELALIQQASNLCVSRTPFSAWLPWADRVIFDLPSTSLFEAALAGVPFHLLLYRHTVLRSVIAEQFAPWLTVFDDPEEAAAAVRRYLSRPLSGLPQVQPEGPDLVALLSSLRRDKESRTDVLDGAPSAHAQQAEQDSLVSATATPSPERVA